MSDGKLLLLRHTLPDKRERLLSLLFSGNRLQQVQAQSGDQLLGNIYLAKVKNVVPSNGACFVEITPGKLCFLPLEEAPGRVKAGEEFPVQITREAMKTKLPSCTTHLSLPGKYVVISRDQRVLGLSSKLSSSRRKELLSFLQEAGLIDEDRHCNSPYSFVIRTNAEQLEPSGYEALTAEWKSLEAQLDNCLQNARTRTCYSCLYQSVPDLVRMVRDLRETSYDEILTDQKDLYDWLKQEMPKAPLRLYTDERISLSSLYGVNAKLETALERRVWLKSGGYLVIDLTEALTVIDVNSGKYSVKRGDPDSTAMLINKEAAEEISLQLKLRNLSGIILVDFINLENEQDQKLLLDYMRKLCKDDPVPTRVIDITALGLMEITRKKISKPLWEQLKES